VQTLVNASGKKRSTVFFFPKLLLSLMSASAGDLDLSVKSGALEPTEIAIVDFSIRFYVVRYIVRTPQQLQRSNVVRAGL